MTDEVMGALTLKVVPSGKFDVYGIPTMRQCYGDNGYSVMRDSTDSVLIFNNYLRRPTYPVVKNYALRLYELDRTIDVNVSAQKTPVLVLCDENERLSLENIYAKYTGNQPVIFGKKTLNPEQITVLTTGAPYVSDKLYELKVSLFNEALTMLGIVNVSIEKKERLLSDEVMRSMGGTFASRTSALSMRDTACDEINDMFGLDVQVVFRSEETDNRPMTSDVESDVEGGSLYE